MNEINFKVEVEKRLYIPKIEKSDMALEDMRCILNDKLIKKYCTSIPCKDCICNIDNLSMLANSHNLQLL